MLPQKRNPDAAELARGKSSRVFGNLMNIVSLLKGLPLAYSKDLQEDKEPVFDSSETIRSCLINLNGILNTLEINKKEMLSALTKGHPTATEKRHNPNPKGRRRAGIPAARMGKSMKSAQAPGKAANHARVKKPDEKDALGANGLGDADDDAHHRTDQQKL